MEKQETKEEYSERMQGILLEMSDVFNSKGLLVSEVVSLLASLLASIFASTGKEKGDLMEVVHVLITNIPDHEWKSMANESIVKVDKNS